MQTKLYTKHGTILIKTPKQCNAIFITDQSDLMTIYLHLRIWYSCILVYKRMIIMWLTTYLLIFISVMLSMDRVYAQVQSASSE